MYPRQDSEKIKGAILQYCNAWGQILESESRFWDTAKDSRQKSQFNQWLWHLHFWMRTCLKILNKVKNVQRTTQCSFHLPLKRWLKIWLYILCKNKVVVSDGLLGQSSWQYYTSVGLRKGRKKTARTNNIVKWNLPLFFNLTEDSFSSCVRETQRKIEEGITWSPW